MLWNIIIKLIKKNPSLILLLISSVLLTVLSSVDLEYMNFTVHATSPIYLRVVSGLLFFIFLFILICEISYHRKNKPLIFNNITISFRIEDIQSIADGSQTSVFVLPVNTNLSDDCITSINSAAGAFFLKHHTPRLNELKDILPKEIVPVATVIVLDDRFNIPGKVILVATSDYSNNRITDPAIVFQSINNVLQKARTYKLNHLYLPVIGSGHGGMSLTEALNLLVICFRYLSNKFTERREITICIRKEDVPNIKTAFLSSFQ